MVSQENTMNVGNDAAGYIPVEADFKFKHTDGELALDDNFAAQSFWKDVLIRYFKKISAVIGLILIIIITVFAIIGPGDRKSTRLNSSHMPKSRMPSSA